MTFYFKKGNAINRQTDKENNKNSDRSELSYPKMCSECFSLPSIPGMYDRVKFARGEKESR